MRTAKSKTSCLKRLKRIEGPDPRDAGMVEDDRIEYDVSLTQIARGEGRHCAGFEREILRDHGAHVRRACDLRRRPGRSAAERSHELMDVVSRADKSCAGTHGMWLPRL